MNKAIEYVLFDLDDTLYPAGTGLMAAISARINAYLVRQLGVTPEAADALRRDYYHRFGSSVRPLITNHHLNGAEFLAYVHDVGVEGALAPDADLDCLLECIQSPKVIFTNGPRAYAERVLRRLAIQQHFVRVFDYEFGNYAGKPTPAIYHQVQAALNVPGGALVMVDDAPRNLAPAHELGWTTILVNPENGTRDAHVDFVVRDLWQVADAFQQLGVMDAHHRAMAEHRLAGCAWAQRRMERAAAGGS